MKRVVFVINTMNVGGVEKSLLGYLGEYLNEGWDVTVAMLQVGGGFLPYLPHEVKVVKIEGFDRIKPLIHNPLRPQSLRAFGGGHIIRGTRLGIYYLQQKFASSSSGLYRYAFCDVPEFSTETYDRAIAFAGPDSFIDFYVATRIHATEKWGWVHFDISRFGIDRGVIVYAYSRFDRINIVSQQGKRIFDERFPDLAHKTYYQPNIIDANGIRAMASETVDLPEHNGMKIMLTVGRVSEEKGQYLVLHALKTLVDSGTSNLQYWMVGAGHDEERCRRFVADNNLETFVVFLGARPNPYPYMAACDFYIQPSVHEGFCITLGEAKLFGMPIIATDFTGAREQLSSYPNSRIVTHSIQAIADAISELIAPDK